MIRPIIPANLRLGLQILVRNTKTTHLKVFTTIILTVRDCNSSDDCQQSSVKPPKNPMTWKRCYLLKWISHQFQYKKLGKKNRWQKSLALTMLNPQIRSNLSSKINRLKFVIMKKNRSSSLETSYTTKSSEKFSIFNTITVSHEYKISLVLDLCKTHFWNSSSKLSFTINKDFIVHSYLHYMRFLQYRLT